MELHQHGSKHTRHDRPGTHKLLDCVPEKELILREDALEISGLIGAGFGRRMRFDPGP